MGTNEVMKFILLCATLAVAVCVEDERILVRLPRQSHGKGGQHDQSSAETGFLGGGGVENSKYFHYQHLPEHDKYEFGHRRGNDHHVIERYEKAIPHEGQFKTKVRWADKKGGHGEHYWDYNHAGHGGNGGQNDGDGGYSDPVPLYHQKSAKQHNKRQLESDQKITLEDVESPQTPEPSFPVKAQNRRDFVQNIEEEIGGVKNFEIQRESGGKQKRAPQPQPAAASGSSTPSDDSHLFFDLKSGQVVDELTGKKYILQPVN